MAALLAAMTLVAAACGSRLPEEALDAIDARDRGAGAGGSAAAGTDASETASGLEGGDQAATSDASSDGATSGGETPTGGNTGGANPTGGNTGGANPVARNTAGANANCRGGATDKGVTATEIRVGNMSTASGPLPGATEGSYRGTAAYLAKINAAGGVCGRKLTLLKGDDGLDPQRGRAEFTRLEPRVLAFVGSLAVADSGYIDKIEETGVPYIGTIVDPAGRQFPNALPRSEENVAHTGPFVYYRQKHPSVRKVGFMFSDVGGVRSNTPASREPLKKVGYQIVYDSGLRVTDPDYTAEVINLRSAGTELLYLFAFEVNMHVRLARNMRQQNWEPKVKVSQIGYNSRLVDLLGDVANEWSNHITYVPMLNADEPARSPALVDFLKWNRQLFPSAQIDLFPVNSWGSAALFVEALQKAGPDVTRKKIIDIISRQITRYDGAGMVAPLNPTNGVTEGCFVVVRVENRKWVREHPKTGYECKLGQRFKY